MKVSHLSHAIMALILASIKTKHRARRTKRHRLDKLWCRYQTGREDRNQILAELDLLLQDFQPGEEGICFEFDRLAANHLLTDWHPFLAVVRAQGKRLVQEQISR